MKYIAVSGVVPGLKVKLLHVTVGSCISVSRHVSSPTLIELMGEDYLIYVD